MLLHLQVKSCEISLTHPPHEGLPEQDPAMAAGGTVKVKDELEIEFHIRGEDVE